MKIVFTGMLVFMMVAPNFADDKKPNAAPDLVVFGMVEQYVGCVIFKEITQKKVATLEVLETQNYEIQQKKWVETAEGSGELSNLAVKDRVKFVKIPEKYTPELLEKARAACKESPPAAAPDQSNAH
jgi:hypothetical protein